MLTTRSSLRVLFTLTLAACGDNAPTGGATDGPRRRADAAPGRSDARTTTPDAVRSAPDAGAGGAPGQDAASPDGPSRADAGGVDGASTERRVTGTVQVGTTGISGAFDFTIPAGTRSVTVIAEGAQDQLLALASLRLGDGTDRVGIDTSVSYASVMQERYNVLQSGAMPGNLYQSIRLGTFTHVYPYAPGQGMPTGAAQLRLASTATSGTVTVTVLLPPEDGARVLHLDVLAVSNTLAIANPPGFLAPLQAIYDQAGIRVVVDQIVEVRGTSFSRITESTEPQEAPQSQSGQLAVLAGQRAPGPGLNVMIVDSLPTGIAGLSLGTPGPPLASGYYHGVIVASAADAQLARVLAHEIAHFLALQHVTNRDTRGQVIPDPIDDTSPGQGNLMENGNTLSPGQSFALQRSALLTAQ